MRQSTYAQVRIQFLCVTFETQHRIAFFQHLGIDAAVRTMANGATFTHSLMLENEWTFLSRMTVQACGIFTTTDEVKCSSARGAVMRIMTIGTSDLSILPGMVVRKSKLTSLICMTTVANRRRVLGIHNRTVGSPTLGMNTSGTMTNLTTYTLLVLVVNGHRSMWSGIKRCEVLFMARKAVFRTYKICIWNIRRHTK